MTRLHDASKSAAAVLVRCDWHEVDHDFNWFLVGALGLATVALMLARP